VPRSVRLPTLWALGTAGALFISMLAVSLIGDRVTSVRVEPLSHQAIEEQLAGQVTPTAAPEDTDSSPGGPSSGAVEVDGRSGGPVGPTSAPPSAGGASGGGGAAGGVSTASVAATVDGGNGNGNGNGGGGSGSGDPAAGSGGAATPIATTTPVAPRQETLTSQGGTVVVECVGSRLTASASPAPGFAVDTSSKLEGTDLDVKFARQDPNHRSEIRARCADGIPTLTESVRETS